MFSQKIKVILMLSLTFMIILYGCASGPSLHTQYDKSTDFSVYRTFGFESTSGTDLAGYSSVITNDFKSSIRRELETRGYTYVETDPDLIVNFNVNSHRENNVHSVPTPTAGDGYYGYRDGLYANGPMNDTQVYVDDYRVGTANIDVVDAKRKQLVWEGVAEGRLTDELMRDPSSAIDHVVTDLFKDYPANAGTAAGDKSKK